MKATYQEDAAEPRGTRFARSPHWVLAPRGDEAALIDFRTGARIALDQLASRVWELTASEPTFPGLVCRLREEYVIDTADLAQQVGLLLSEWLEAGFIRISVRARRGVRVPAFTRRGASRAVSSVPNVNLSAITRGDARRRTSGAPVIGVLAGAGGVRDDIRRELASVGEVRFFEAPELLVSHAVAGKLDAIVTELQDERGDSVAPMVVALAGRAHSLPLILYMKKLNRATVDSLLAVLTPGLCMHSVIRQIEQLRPLMRWVLSSDPPPCVSAILAQRLLPKTTPELRPFTVLASLKASRRPSVAQLARGSGITVRTLERRLQREGWAHAHVIIQAFRAVDAAWLVTEYGWSARKVRQEREFASEGAVTRLMRRYCGVTPALIREGADFDTALANAERIITLRASA